MEKSESIKSLAKALTVFHARVEKINKDADNPLFKSRYASLSNILESIRDALSESNLTFCQFPTGEYGLTTILMHSESGEFIQSDYTMKPVIADPQGIGSAITYQRRYALAAILGLNIDDDDDANDAAPGLETKKETGGIPVDKPWLNEGTRAFEGAIRKLQSGTTTIQKIREFYKVSRPVEIKLTAAAKAQPA